MGQFRRAPKDPEKIILFGSAARGAMGPHSDLDLLVIKAGEYNHLELVQRLYRALSRSAYSKDIIVATPEEIERFKDSYCMVFYPAVREGKLLYARDAVPA